jgi:hypothetical protein
MRGDNRAREPSVADFDTELVLLLPERIAMSLVNANAAIPINAAVAGNVLSDSSAAEANANQETPITQDNIFQ